MNKQQFLTELQRLLVYMTPEDREHAAAFFGELFDTVGETGEAELIRHLGTPTKVAITLNRGYQSGQVETVLAPYITELSQLLTASQSSFEPEEETEVVPEPAEEPESESALAPMSVEQLEMDIFADLPDFELPEPESLVETVGRSAEVPETDPKSAPQPDDAPVEETVPAEEAAFPQKETPSAEQGNLPQTAEKKSEQKPVMPEESVQPVIESVTENIPEPHPEAQESAEKPAAAAGPIPAEETAAPSDDVPADPDYDPDAKAEPVPEADTAAEPWRADCPRGRRGHAEKAEKTKKSDKPTKAEKSEKPEKSAKEPRPAKARREAPMRPAPEEETDLSWGAVVPLGLGIPMFVFIMLVLGIPLLAVCLVAVIALVVPGCGIGLAAFLIGVGGIWALSYVTDAVMLFGAALVVLAVAILVLWLGVWLDIRIAGAYIGGLRWLIRALLGKRGKK